MSETFFKDIRVLKGIPRDLAILGWEVADHRHLGLCIDRRGDLPKPRLFADHEGDWLVFPTVNLQDDLAFLATQNLDLLRHRQRGQGRGRLLFFRRGSRERRPGGGQDQCEGD